jgi:hypothetical protein
MAAYTSLLQEQLQGLQLATPLLGAGLAETVLGLQVIAQLNPTAVMLQALQAADRQLVLAGVAAAPGRSKWGHCRQKSPQVGWLCSGRQVSHFRPDLYERFSQALELTTGELIPGHAPLLKCCREITREEAIRLWAKKRKAGWQVCPPQWTQPPEVKPPARGPAASIG